MNNSVNKPFEVSTSVSLEIQKQNIPPKQEEIIINHPEDKKNTTRSNRVSIDTNKESNIY
jgi:hypothetical protein